MFYCRDALKNTITIWDTLRKEDNVSTCANQIVFYSLGKAKPEEG